MRALCLIVLAAIGVPWAAQAGVNTWTSMGPFGGPLIRVAVVQASPDTLWAQGVWGGVYRSTDGGITWASAAGSQSFVFFGDNGYLTPDPVRPEVAWVAEPGRLWRTGDNGATWTPELFAQSFAVGVAPSAPGTVYAAEKQSTGQLYRTTDDGATWTALAAVPAFVRSVAVHPTTPGTLFVASSNGNGWLYKSIDAGVTLVPSNVGLETMKVSEVAIDPVNPNVMLVTTNQHGIRRSTDGGASWQATVGAGNNPYDIAFDGAGNAWASHTTGGVLRSVDGGASWSPVPGVVSSSISDVAAHPTMPGVAWLATTGGILKTVDAGTTWTTEAEGIAATIVEDIAVDPVAPNVVYAATQGVGLHKSTDGGTTWAPVGTGIASANVMAVAVDPLAPNIVWAAADVVYKSVDGGVTWSPTGLGGAQQLIPDPTTSGTVYANSGGQMRKTTDGGATWPTIQSGITGSVRSVTMDPTAPQVLYAGTSAQGVFKTINGGGSWTPVSSGLPAIADVLAIAVDPAAPQTVYVSLNVAYGLHRSTNGGATWSPTGCGSRLALLVVPGAPSLLLIGDAFGRIAATTDGGVTCPPLAPASTLPQAADVFALAYDPTDPRRLYAGGEGGGAFVMDRYCGNGMAEPGEACDLGASNGATGTCCTSQCAVRSASTVCRAAAGPCDVVETCDGASGACPADALRSPASTCRPAAGPCDAAELCSGIDVTCPPDIKSTDTCRPVAGPCDVVEACDGVANECPTDEVLPTGTTCRAAAGDCDVAETCTGGSATCPPDAFQLPTQVCRAAAGACDVAESCPGDAAACPADTLRPGTYVCRASAGTCDVAESCTGASASCPPDGLEPSSHVCRPAVGDCDVAETCTGVDTVCPSDAVQPDGTSCSDGMSCTIADSCVAGTCTGDSVTCGDGIVQGSCGEECDDGNLVDGDGCSSSCALEFNCFAGPVSGCRRPSQAGKSSVLVKNEAVDGRDKLKWNWSRGATTPKGDFGSPLTTTDYLLCVYDAGLPVSSTLIPAGQTCAGRPCWKETGSGFKYKNATAGGAMTLGLKEGVVPGKAKIVAQGKGLSLDTPPLPMTQPVLVQLRNSSTSVCWEAEFVAPAQQNDARGYKARSN